jgi:hypothetical protein
LQGCGVRFLSSFVLAGWLLLPTVAVAEPETPSAAGESAGPPAICEAIDAGAAAYDLPVAFFTRLIWKDSRFRADAVSPKGAQGIAQFMPGTASLRGLADPFDPAQAIPASAHYLSDLEDRFGNLGLAAAAYNAGEDRVTRWLAGDGILPLETRGYVSSITGYTAEAWRNGDAEADVEQTGARALAVTTCGEVAALLANPGAGAAPLPGPAASAPAAPWGVQVAGNFSEAKARATYASIRRQYASVLGDRDPLVLRSVMRSRGTAPYFNVRVGAETRAGAVALCAKLRAIGGACVVLKN